MSEDNDSDNDDRGTPNLSGKNYEKKILFSVHFYRYGRHERCG